MSTAEADFSAPPEVLTFDGLLFDFDGTIIDSTDAIVKHWHKLGEEMGVDPNVILATSHGRRSIDTLKLYDEKKANWDYVSEIEGRIPREYGQDAVEIPGARAILENLENAGAPWAVVTSGTRALIEGWLHVLKLAHPKFLVVAEDVEVGKPDPRCYLLGRSRLGLDHSTSILVIEDAPSGIKAGKAAGFKVLGLATTHTIDQLKAAGADWIVRDLRSVALVGVDGQVKIEIKNALR
ncbi:DL-glycerol-3-phosphatase [Paecilomyces lecythidis]|uniref:DL-glycerol-3-phosphatase n=1 Tax=Paecilomyces lecythidis TaxID=3004212 RepID=A0ABR3XHJ0_9EURO